MTNHVQIMMYARKLLTKEYKQNLNTFDYMTCVERIKNRCFQTVLYYALNGYTYVCECIYNKPSKHEVNEIEYIQDRFHIIHDKTKDLYRIVYNEETVPIEKVDKYPFLFIVLKYGEDESLDIFKVVKKYMVKGNIFNRELLSYILDKHFKKEMEDINDFEVSILNKEVIFETLPPDFSFDL